MKVCAVGGFAGNLADSAYGRAGGNVGGQFTHEREAVERAAVRVLRRERAGDRAVRVGRHVEARQRFRAAVINTDLVEHFRDAADGERGVAASRRVFHPIQVERIRLVLLQVADSKRVGVVHI